MTGNVTYANLLSVIILWVWQIRQWYSKKTKGDIKLQEYLGVNSPKTNALYSPLFKRLVDNPLSSISTSWMVHCEGVRKELCTCSWPVKISSWKINTDVAAACYWLFSLQVPKSVREQDFNGRVVAILLSLQNGGTRRDECHIARSKGEREKEMVSGAMLDVICFSRDWDDCKLFSWFLRSAKIHLCWCWWFLTNPVSITS